MGFRFDPRMTSRFETPLSAAEIFTRLERWQVAKKARVLGRPEPKVFELLDCSGFLGNTIQLAVKVDARKVERNQMVEVTYSVSALNRVAIVGWSYLGILVALFVFINSVMEHDGLNFFSVLVAASFVGFIWLARGFSRFLFLLRAKPGDAEIRQILQAVKA